MLEPWAVSRESKLTCLLLGEEPLLTRCGDVLRERGHLIQAVVTTSAFVRRWCEDLGLRVLARDEYARFISESPVDVLLSITHPNLIAPEVIASARVAALNYHDGPLPRYAGMNGSAWALLNGESRHAIVWHHLDKGLDTGNIVEWRDVELEPRETSLSLNMKNAVLALDSFRSLLARLESGDLRGEPQRTDVERSVFSRHDRPAALTTLDFSLPARAADCLVRACDFGHYPNRFGLAKIVHGESAVIVREARPVEGAGEPSMVLRIDDDAMDVACGEGVLRLRRFSTLFGEPLSASQAAAALGVRPSIKLEDATRKAREAVSRSVAEAEPFFVKTLSVRLPLSLPFEIQESDGPLRVAVVAPPAFAARFGDLAADAAITAFALVLSTLCREDEFDLACVDCASESLGALSPLFFPAVPLRLSLEAGATFDAAARAAQRARQVLAKRGPFLRDLIARHPALADQPALLKGELSQAAVVIGSGAAPPGARLTLRWEAGTATLASSGGIPESRLRSVAQHLSCVIAQVSERPVMGISEIDLLEPGELFRQVFAWNATLRAFSDDLCIHQLFEEQVTARPDAVALVFEDRTMTFAEVERAANRIANALALRGVGPGSYVGISLERSFELVLALLGVAKSGAAYVPLDASYPADRVEFMLRDAGCAVLVTSSDRAPAFPEQRALLVDGAEVRGASDARPARAARPTDVCYVIYTSGSTGQPKGVVLTHSAVLNTLEWVNRTFAVTPNDRLLFVTSPSFDLSVYDVFGALGAGASVEIASAALLADPTRLVEKLAGPGLTIWDSAPAALARLVSFFPERAPSSSLRLVMLSGDWIPLSLPPVLERTFAGVEVESLGGATEAAIWSNHFPVRELDPAWTSVPYGRPIQNARYYVLDRRLRPVPVGVAGDLYIGGACLAKGYLNRPELTAERFLADPFIAGERIYKTGDLARYFKDGTLEFLGRADFQVKIRGFRVELGEVEHALAALPGVRDAICSAYVDASGSKSLAAYVVARKGCELDEQRMKDTLARSLPDFMVPSHVVVLSAFPVTPNGKVDRKALPSPAARAVTTPYVAPRSDLERSLVALWEELLERKPIGISDDFFALGGHSLLAVMLVTRLKGALGLDVPLSRVLEHPNIAAFAASIADQHAAPQRRTRHLLALHAQGSRPPLVLVAGVGGFAFTYRNFPKLLGADQPVLTFTSVGAEDKGELTEHTIEQMAQIYEEELLEAAPEGSLVIGGFSFGALPAFELASRLIQRGRDVPLIVSFDGFAPGYPRVLPLKQRVVAHVREFIGRDRAGKYAYLRDRAARVQKRAYQLIGRAEALAPRIPFADQEMTERMRKLWVLHMRARERYAPTARLPCDLLLLKAAVPFRWVATEMDDPNYGWRSFVSGNISAVTVPGDHTQFFSNETQPMIAAAVAQHIARYSGSARASRTG